MIVRLFQSIKLYTNAEILLFTFENCFTTAFITIRLFEQTICLVYHTLKTYNFYLLARCLNIMHFRIAIALSSNVFPLILYVPKRQQIQKSISITDCQNIKNDIFIFMDASREATRVHLKHHIRIASKFT